MKPFSVRMVLAFAVLAAACFASVAVGIFAPANSVLSHGIILTSVLIALFLVRRKASAS